MLIFGDWHEFPGIWVDILFWSGFDTRHRVACFLGCSLDKSSAVLLSQISML